MSLKSFWGLGGGGGVEKLAILFVIPDLTVVSGGNFVGSGTPIQAATTTVANDSLVMPANNTAIIASLTLAGCYSQFYTNDTTPKTVLLSDIYLTNDQIIKSGNYLALLPNPFQRNLISALYDTKSVKRATVNLLNDPTFSETSKVADRTIGKLVFWNDSIPYAGANGASIEYVNDTILINGRKHFYLKLNAGTLAANPGTRISQRIILKGVKTTDKISLSCWVRTSTAAGGSLAYRFFDRNNNQIATYAGINVGNTAGVWTEKKIENIAIPVSEHGISAFELNYYCGANNNSIYITQPCVNLGATALEFENKYDEYSSYAGIERFIAKCLAGTAVNVSIMGDSLTRNGDTSQTSNLSYLAKELNAEIPRLFGNTVTVRNNAADGNNQILELMTLKKFSLDHNSDLTFLMSGRNTENGQDEIDSRLKIVETNIRRILTQSIDNDVVVTLPFFRKLYNPIAEGEQPYYVKDTSLINQNAALKTKYKLANIFSAQKVKEWADTADTTETWDQLYMVDAVHLQSGGGHILRAAELRYLIARALRYANVRASLASPITEVYNISPTTLFPSDFGVIEDTVKSGTWTDDTNPTLANGALTASGTNLGEWELPIVSSAQGDYLEVGWTGKHFSVMFLPGTNRGTATVTIDSVDYDISTNGAINNNMIGICTYSRDSIKFDINLTEGSHTLKISQKNAGVNDKISVALVTVF